MSDTTPGSEPTSEPTPEPTPDPTPSGTTSSGAITSGQAVDTLKGAHRLDLGVIGAGVLVFLGSLLPYYTVSVDGFGASASSSVNAWHGFFGWFAAVLALAGEIGLPFSRIGRFEAGAGLALTDRGAPAPLPEKLGFEHG